MKQIISEFAYRTTANELENWRRKKMLIEQLIPFIKNNKTEIKIHCATGRDNKHKPRNILCTDNGIENFKRWQERQTQKNFETCEYILQIHRLFDMSNIPLPFHNKTNLTTLQSPISQPRNKLYIKFAYIKTVYILTVQVNHIAM